MIKPVPIAFASLAAALALVAVWHADRQPAPPRFDPLRAGASWSIEDRSVGADHREAIRRRLAEAIAAFEAGPCDPAPRQALFAAWSARAALLDSEGRGLLDPDNSMLWHTQADLEIEAALQRLVDQGYVTQDELSQALLIARADWRRQLADATIRSPDPSLCVRTVASAAG